MENFTVVRYGEIFLKGKNRGFFEKKLVNNIVQCLNINNIDGIVKKKRNRIFINKDVSCIRNVFGIVSFSNAICVENSLDEIKKASVSLLERLEFDTFRVSARRITKTGNLSSDEINKMLGAFIVSKFGKGVSLKKYDVNVGVEVIDEKAYIFLNTVRCFGGLPVGVSGKVIVLLEDSLSVLSALLMMKRGCDVILAGFEKNDISLIEKFMFGEPVFFLVREFGDLEGLAVNEKADGVVIGSTFETFKEINLNIPILRPLIGLSVDEAKEKLRTYES